MQQGRSQSSDWALVDMFSVPITVVSIGIVTYNSENHIVACLRSVFSQTWPSLEVVVLDNCSSDRTVDRVREHFPDVRLLVNPRNTGFSGGHNRLIGESEGAHYLALNPDVVLTTTYVEEMIRALEREPDIGWVSGKLLFLAQEGERTNRIYTTGHEIHRNGAVSNIGYGDDDHGQYGQAAEVFGANAAAALYRREMLEDVRITANQYFDELFFMYGTDPELDWRARILGWRCWYTPRAVGYHVGHASAGLNDPRIRLDYLRRRYIMVLKCADRYDLLFYYVPMMFADLVAALSSRNRTLTKAIVGVVPHLPEIARKRHRMMARRRAARDQLRRWFKPGQVMIGLC